MGHAPGSVALRVCWAAPSLDPLRLFLQGPEQTDTEEVPEPLCKKVRLWAGDVRVTSFQPWCLSSLHLVLAERGSEPQAREMGNEGEASRKEAACLDSGVLRPLGTSAEPPAWGKTSALTVTTVASICYSQGCCGVTRGNPLYVIDSVPGT